LEQVLKPFPVSDRAEIITEIKSHILSARERDPEGRLDSVLSALGEPETVANRYLIERGLKPTKPPISPVVKWVVIGFLGTVAMLFILIGVVITRFTPLLQIDDLKDKVSLFGGMIQVDGDKGKVWINGSFGDGDGYDSGEGSENAFEGSTAISKGQNISVKFKNGKVELTNSTDSKLSWDCTTRGSKAAQNFNPTIDKNGVALDLSDLRGVRCELSVPENTQLSVNGKNGKIEINEPHYNLNADLKNGHVQLNPDEEHAYRYSLSVTNGNADTYVSSDKPEAHLISIHLVNGKIVRSEGNI
jgi:hypothetical protein